MTAARRIAEARASGDAGVAATRAASPAAASVRPMVAADLPSVAAIYLALVGRRPPDDWNEGLSRLLATGARSGAALVAALPGGEVVGYAVGEVRSWEFGSPPAGWITGLGVARAHQHGGVARRLLSGVVDALRAAGVASVRTMAKRDDVAVLRLFRSGGFSAGPYVELELGKEPS